MEEISQLQQQVRALTTEVESLGRMFSEHCHNGSMDQRVDITDLVGMIPVVSTAPTHSPRDFQEQFCIYKNSTTSRFYWYDWVNKEWRYATGT